jgi:hypothetical protein
MFILRMIWFIVYCFTSSCISDCSLHMSVNFAGRVFYMMKSINICIGSLIPFFDRNTRVKGMIQLF